MLRSFAITAVGAGSRRFVPVPRTFHASAVALDKRPPAPRLRRPPHDADGVSARQALNDDTKRWIEGMYGGEGSWAPKVVGGEGGPSASVGLRPAAATTVSVSAVRPAHAGDSKEERTQRRRERRANKRGREAQAREAHARVRNGQEAAVGNGGVTATKASEDAETQRRRWEPTRKLTYAAMAGVRELHAQDPQTWTRAALADKFGVSFEAVSRILRSKWQDKKAASAPALGKWAKGESSDDSPVPYIRAVYDIKRRSQSSEEEHLVGKPGKD